MPRREDSTVPLKTMEQVLLTLTTCTWPEGTTTSWHTNKYNHESRRWHYFTAPRAGVLEGQSNPELSRGHQSLWMLLVVWGGMDGQFNSPEEAMILTLHLQTLSHLTQPLLPKKPRHGKHITEQRGGGSKGTEKTLETAQVRHTEKWFCTLTSISKKGRKWWGPRDYHLQMLRNL